jgi:chain length determinant protein EpsF
MTLFQFLTIIRARWRAMLVVLSLIVGAAIGVSLLLPKQYRAETQVVIDVRSDPVTGPVVPGMLAPGYIATQVDIVNSERLALMVVDKLGLAEDQLAIEAFREQADGKGSIRLYYSDRLRKKLEVKPSRDSSLISIAFTGKDPSFAAAVANAFAQAYVDTNIEMKVEPAKQQRNWFAEQALASRQQLHEAQRKLNEYQQTNKIVTADERLDVETARLQELSTQLTVATAETVDSGKRKQQVERMVRQGSIQELPEVLQNPLVQQLKANQAALEAKLREQGAVLGAQHPEIIKMTEELRGTQERARQEALTVAGSLTRTHLLNQQREAELRDSLEAQRQRVLSMKSGREQLTSLQRDVESAQRAYESISQRLSQTGLESQVSSANLFVLHPAMPPNQHASPKLPLNIAVAVVVGAMLAIGTALLREKLGRRIRGPGDLVQAVQAPLLVQVRRVQPRLLRDAKSRKVSMRQDELTANRHGQLAAPQQSP